MKILFVLFLSSLFSTCAMAGVVAPVSSPKMDALTSGSATTDASVTTTIVKPAVRKSAPRPAPAKSSKAAPAKDTSAPTPAPAQVDPVIETPTPTGVATESKLARIYVGAQLGDSIVGGLVGLQVSKMFSVEARYDYVDTIYVPNGNTKSSNLGIAGVALFPLKLSDLKLSDMEPFYLFGKAGYERSTKKTTSVSPDLGVPGFPSTTTITTTVKGRLLIGGGAQYDFSKKFSGRVGVNFVGSDSSMYLTAIYKL